MEAAQQHGLKTRWAECELVAQKIGDVTKTDVFQHYTDLYRPGYFSHILMEQQPSVEIIGKAREIAKSKKEKSYPRVVDPKEQSAVDYKNRKTADASEDLKLALWYLNKIGDTERAKIALNIAIEAAKKLAR